MNEDDFGQPGIFWQKVLNPEEKRRFVNNLVDHMKNASTFLIERAVRNFTCVNVELGQQLSDALRQAGVQINLLGKSASL
jgi:catalase